MKELSERKSPSSTISPPSIHAKVSRNRECLRLESAARASPLSTGRPKHISSESFANPRVKRSVLPDRPKSDGENVACKRETEAEDSKIGSRLRRRSETNSGRFEVNEHEATARDLQRRLDESEMLVKKKSLEILCLKEEIEKLTRLNVELEKQNKKLACDLSTAEIKILALDRREQAASAGKEGEPSDLAGAQKHISNSLGPTSAEKILDKESISHHTQTMPLNPGTKPVEVNLQKRPLQSSPDLKVPPPPPPPPPSLHPKRESKTQKATALLEFYHCLTKRDVKNNGNCSSPVGNSVHNSIVGELQNRSAHLLAIKADVETKGELIKHLINSVESAAYTNMEDVLTFVDWLDGELSKLADERAVLKHFNWPERKADALREAAFEYRDIKQLYAEVSSFTDNVSLTCETILRKIANLVERSERNVQMLIKLRGIAMAAYRECKIPTDWMLDSGMISMIKLASVRLAKIYIKRVLTELDFSWQLERRSTQESLLSQGVRFAYRVYQFVGGLDPETMSAFEELRSRVQWRQSRDATPGMPLP